jgi:hypothetical protein
MPLAGCGKSDVIADFLVFMGRGSLISGIARSLVVGGDAGYAERLRAE